MRTKLIPLTALITTLALSACGSSTPYDDDYYAATLCIDQRTNLRVPDTYCPIGDGISNQSFGWAYSPYRYDAPDLDIVYVGYPVPASYTRTRPANVRTTHLDRGRFAEAPSPADTRSSTRVPSIPTIQRGGLGVPASSTRSGDTAPKSSVSSESPKSGSGTSVPPKNASRANTAPKAAVIPPPPPSRPIAPPANTSAGSKVKVGK